MRFAHYYGPLFGPPAGVTAAIAAWSEALARAGNSVVLLGDGDPADSQQAYPDTAEVHGIPHRGRGRVSRIPVRLRRYLAKSDVLVLHEGWLVNHYAAAAQAVHAGVPYIVVPHGVHNPEWAAMMRALSARRLPERRLLQGAAAVHVFFDSEIATEQRLAPGARCLVAPSGVGLPAKPWTGGRPELLWVGRYSVEHKGLDHLVRAVAATPVDTRPLIALRGFDYRGGKSAVRALAQELEVSDYVDVGPPVTGAEKDELLRTCAGYVLPSRWESHSIALLEALARGVPTLASDRMPISSELQDARAALVCDLAPRALSAAMAELVAMPLSERAELGARGRRWVAARFDWDAVVKAYVSAVHDAVRQSAGPPSSC